MRIAFTIPFVAAAALVSAATPPPYGGGGPFKCGQNPGQLEFCTPYKKACAYVQYGGGIGAKGCLDNHECCRRLKSNPEKYKYCKDNYFVDITCPKES